MTKLGQSVVIVDLDSTGANVHTALGQNPAQVSLRDWVEGRKTLAEIVTPVPLPRLSFVQGFWDNWCPMELKVEQVKRLIPELRALNTDYVIVDLGPGATEANLEMFKAGDEKILVTTPEPTSIEKTYRFVESHICAKLIENARPEAFASMLTMVREHRNSRARKPFSFRQYLKENDGFVIDHFDELSRKPVRLLVNSSRSQANVQLGFAMKSVCHKYYDLRLDYLGAIEYDNAVWQSVRSREPVLVAQPFTSLAGQFLTVCKHLIAPEEVSAVG